MYAELTDAVYKAIKGQQVLRTTIEGALAHSPGIEEGAEAVKLLVKTAADLKKGNPIACAVLETWLDECVDWERIARTIRMEMIGANDPDPLPF